MMRLVVVLVRRLVERRRASMMKRAAVVMRVIGVGRRVLLARMRVLWRVIDIIRSYSVVARQRASDTWVPPERTALAGRRALNGKNLIELSPAGLRRRERLLAGREVANVCGASRKSELSSDYSEEVLLLVEQEPSTCVFGRGGYWSLGVVRVLCVVGPWWVGSLLQREASFCVSEEQEGD